jgi:non-specific serine/threonine protein kinase
MLAVEGDSGVLFRYRFGDSEFDEAQFELRVGGEAIEVQPKPLELLALLLRTPGEVVTSGEILQSVWKYQNPDALETNVIGTALTKLRNALGKDARRIVNLPRVGYRFEGRVERVVVGRTLSSGLALEPGMPVPLRHNFVLRELLSRSRYSEVWRARHAKTDEARIYKFSPAGDRLAALKREATLYRVLRDTLGERNDFARVIDWNFAEAPFFLECEDGGQNLRKWAEQDGRLQGMSQPQRVELLLQIADAVAAAHRVGVLHKDLKPDNVLISPRGEGWQVKLTDFGSGQLLEPARLEDLGITMLGFTATQGVVNDATTGTLLYMAPELARGEPPTAQSDVYALGLLLYQLVIGDMRRPLVPGWQREVSDELLQQDIATATDGNPAHRLGSAAELTSRLRHIAARRDELVQRRQLERLALQAQESLQRTRARRPWLIALLASLLAGCMVCASLFYQSHQAYLRAEEQRSRAEAINRFLNEDLLGAADPGGPGAQRDPTVKQLLSRAAGRLDGRFGSDPLTKASLDLTIGQSYFGLSDYADAEAFQRRGITQLTASKGAADAATIEAQYMLARTIGLQSRFDETSALLDQADRAAGSRLEQPTRLAMLSAWARGGYYAMRMQPALALPHFERAERVRLQVMPDDQAWLLHLHGAMAWCYVRTNRNQDALATLTPLLQPAYSAENIGVAEWEKVRMHYAQALANLSRYDEAEATLKDALRVVQRLMGEDHFETGMVWDYLGEVYQYTGRWRDAIAAHERAATIARLTVGAQSRNVAILSSELAVSHYYIEGAAEALPLLQAAHAALAAKLGQDSAFTQGTAFYLASALSDLDRPADAQALLEQVQADALNTLEPQQDWGERIAGLHGRLLMQEGKPAEGRAQVEDALGRLTVLKAPDWMTQPLQAALNKAGGTKLARE